ncbi:MAG: palindromic element RPE4 domain-containing protein [Rickettsia endosymbiont of Haemaphysalis japonica]
MSSRGLTTGSSFFKFFSGYHDQVAV